MEIENIKFKAKQLNSGKWFEGDLVRLRNRVCIGGDHIKDGITDVDPTTVCQFTGLLDCEGNEIWEGDILAEKRFPSFEVGYINCTFAAAYMGDDRFIFNLLALSKTCKVCGSKFDRKEGEKNDEEKNI